MPLPDEDITARLWNADPECEHELQDQWSGVRCIKCRGWFCF